MTWAEIMTFPPCSRVCFRVWILPELQTEVEELLTGEVEAGLNSIQEVSKEVLWVTLI